MAKMSANICREIKNEALVDTFGDSFFSYNKNLWLRVVAQGQYKC